MTLQASFGGMVPNPIYLVGAAQAMAFQMIAIDASGEKHGSVFRCPKAGTIARVHVRTGTVVTGGTVRLSLQDVDATTGDPDGTADQYRDLTIQNADDNVWFRSGLVTSDGTDTGTTRTVTKGQLLSIVLDFPSFTSENINFAGVGAQPTRGPFVAQCYVDHFTTAWAKSVNTLPVFALEYDDGSFAFLPGAVPISTVSSQTLNTGTTPDEAGLVLTLPYSATVWGAWYVSNHAGDFQVVLYDAGGSVLASCDVDKDVSSPAGALAVAAREFASPPSIAAGAQVRLVLRPTTATSLTLAYYDVERAGILDQLDGGQAIHWTQRTNEGAWSETTTRRASMGLILGALDDGVSAGGGGRRPRMRVAA